MCWGKKSQCSRRALVFVRLVFPEICRAALVSSASWEVGFVVLAMRVWKCVEKDLNWGGHEFCGKNVWEYEEEGADDLIFQPVRMVILVIPTTEAVKFTLAERSSAKL